MAERSTSRESPMGARWSGPDVAPIWPATRCAMAISRPAYSFAANHYVDSGERGVRLFRERGGIAVYCAYRLGRFESAIGPFRSLPRQRLHAHLAGPRRHIGWAAPTRPRGDAEAAAEAYALGARNGYQVQLLRPTRSKGTWRFARRSHLSRYRTYGLAKAGFTGSTVFHAALLYYEAGQGVAAPNASSRI